MNIFKINFKCPHCEKIITEKDLEASQSINSSLKEFFLKKEEIYKKELEQGMLKEKEKQFEHEKNALLSQKELEIQKIKQQEIDNLKNLLKQQEIKIQNNENELAKLLSQKELEIHTKKQQEIEEIKKILQEKNIQIKNQKSETEAMLLQKELEIHTKKQQEIDNLKNLLKQQDIKIQNNETELEKLLSQKELEIHTKKQQEIEEIKKLLQAKEIQLQNNKSQTEAMLSQKELEIHTKKQQEIEEIKKLLQAKEIQLQNNKSQTEAMLFQKELEIQKIKQQEIDNLKKMYFEERKQLEENIKELELANTLNKVIQNKTKGENFEHDVEKFLRDSFEPDDIIEKITSGDKKADYLQKIRLNGEKEIGRIVYEVKNAEWKDTWEKKLIGDMAKENSKYGILIATSLNKKYPGIMFKRSDTHPNIYLVDSENFVAIGQLIKSLIKTEYKIAEQYSGKQLEEKLSEFKKWREIQIPLIHKTMQDNIERIEKAENSISKQLNEVRIGREKITAQWLYKIKEFIENLVL